MSNMGEIASYKIRKELDSVKDVDLLQVSRLAWEYHKEMGAAFPAGGWEIMKIELPELSWQVSRGFVNKINLICAFAPMWARIIVEWKADRCIASEAGTIEYFAKKARICTPNAQTGFYTRTSILASFLD